MQVACGAAHTAAIDRDGNLWAWGANTSAQLGTGDTSERLSPTRVRPFGGSRGEAGMEEGDGAEESLRALSVACSNHTVVLAAPMQRRADARTQLWVFGANV